MIGMTGADTTTAGFGMLQVSGNITPGVDNSYTLGSAARRWSAVYAANGTIQTSDARLKTNVITMEPAEALAMVNALRPVRYNWINPQDGTNRKVGFLAHELAAVLPEVVYLPLPADQNGFLGVNYSEIVPALVGAINAQQLIIGKLTPTPAGLKFSGEFEATVLRSKKAYLDEITAKTIQADLIKAKEIEAEKIVSGEMNVASGAGCVGLFSMKPGAVYEVRSLAAGGGWASMRIGMANTGPVIQTREASKDGLLDLNVLAGNTVCATVAAGQQARASWLRVL